MGGRGGAPGGIDLALMLCGPSCSCKAAPTPRPVPCLFEAKRPDWPAGQCVQGQPGSALKEDSLGQCDVPLQSDPHQTSRNNPLRTVGWHQLLCAKSKEMAVRQAEGKQLRAEADKAAEVGFQM